MMWRVATFCLSLATLVSKSTPRSCFDSAVVIVNGNFQSTHRGDQVKQFHFWCDEGFNLVGNRTVQCLSVGRWTSALPTCVKAPTETNRCGHSRGFIPCASGTECIEVSMLCDGVDHCSDSSDEDNCTPDYRRGDDGIAGFAAARADGKLQPPAVLMSVALVLCRLIHYM